MLVVRIAACWHALLVCCCIVCRCACVCERRALCSSSRACHAHAFQLGARVVVPMVAFLLLPAATTLTVLVLVIVLAGRLFAMRCVQLSSDGPLVCVETL